VVIGDALKADSFERGVVAAETFVHLVGVSHPAPWKEAEFRAVDLASLKASVAAALEGGVKNFVYVSVAQPAPVMQAYIRVRSECEKIITHSGLNATFLRPWYVLGPGRRWPVLLTPMYRLFEKVPGKRDTALRLGLVTIEEMVLALAWAVENPPAPEDDPRIISVPQIREAARNLRPTRGGGSGAHATAVR
jgi:uncharacterized protein YbjT (DUF2867 family)